MTEPSPLPPKASSSLGPYREVRTAETPPPRALSRWLLVPAVGSLAVAGGLLLFAPREHVEIAIADLPTDIAGSVLRFPADQEALEPSTPLAPLLTAAQPEDLAMLTPEEGVTRVMRGDVLRMRFNRPMVRASQVSRALPAMPIPLDPPVPGVATWTSRSTLEFVPDTSAFDRNMETRITFPEAMTSLEGEALFDDEVERLIVLDGIPRLVRNNSQVASGEPLPIFFNTPVTAATLAGQILLYEQGGGSRSVDVQVRPVGMQDDLFRVDLVPRRNLEPGARIGLAIAPAFLSWGGDTPGYYSFSVQPRPRFVGIGCTTSEYNTAGCTYTENPGEIIDIEAELMLLATHPLADFAPGLVQITPPLAGLHVEVRGESMERKRHVVIRGEWEPDQVYEVRIANLVTETGERVTSPGPLAIRSQGHPAQVAVAGGFHTYERGVPFSVPFTGINLAQAQLRVRRVNAGEEQAALTHPEAFIASSNAHTSSLATLAPDARPNRWGRGNVMIDAETGPLAVVGFSPTGSTEPADLHTMVVQQTDLGVSAVATDDGMVVWVTHISNAAPVEGAHVSVWNGTSTAVGDETTNADGVAFIRAAGGSALFGESVIGVTTSDDHAALSLSVSSAVGSAQLGIAAGGTPSLSDVHGSVVADRGIYRPGESVRVVALARRIDGGTATLPSAQPVELRLWDPSGTIPYATRSATLDDRGAVDGTFELPDPAPSGDWRVELVLRDEAHTKVGETSLLVSEYREPRLRLDVAMREPRLLANETMHATLGARYLFGAPVQHGQIAWQLARTGPAALPSRWSELSVGPATENVRYQVLAEETVDLDNDGSIDIEGAVQMTVPRRTRFELSVTAEDASGESTTQTRAFTVYPGAVEIGMAADDDWVALGTALEARVVAFSSDGEPALNTPINVSVVREGWHGWWEWHGGNEDGALQLRRAREAQTVATCALVSAEDLVTCAHTPDRPGTYRLTARTADGVIAERLVYVAGPDESPDRDPPGAPISITAQRTDYTVGETAELVFESPWPEAEALITINEAGVTHRERRHVTAGAQTISLPLTDAMVPNIHVALVLVRPRTGEPSATSDLHAPDLRFGALDLAVGPRTSRLAVSIEQASEEARAGTSTNVGVRVLTADGAPLQNAEVVLWAVDEGTLRMSGYQVADPTNGFFVHRGGALAMEDIRRGLVSRLPGALETTPSGDGGYEQGASALASRERYEPTVLWMPRLRTDADGRVSASIDLPERTTEYRIMAMAIDDHASAGSASSSLTVSRPLVVRPALPRFVTDGDSVGLRIFVNNSETEPVAAHITVSLAGSEVASTDLNVDGESEGSVIVPVEVHGTTTADFTIHVTSSTDDVTVTRALPIVPRAYFVRQSVLVAGTGERVLEVGVPAGVLVGRLRARVATHPFLDADAQLRQALGSWWHSTNSDAATLIAAASASRLAPMEVVTQEEREQHAAIEAAIRRLLAHQTATGGFFNYAAYDGEDVATTVFAVFALVEATREGVSLGLSPALQARLMEHALPRGIERLATLVRNREIAYYGPRASDDQALALRVLATLEQPDNSARDVGFERRQFASPFELAQLSMAYPQNDQRRQTLVLDACRRILQPAAGDPFAALDMRTLASVTEAASTVRSGRRFLRPLLTRVLERRGEVMPEELAWMLHAEATVAEGLSRGTDGFSTDATSAHLTLSGNALTASSEAGTRAPSFEIPIAQLAGNMLPLVATTSPNVPVFLALDGEWAVPVTEAEDVARGHGITLHRILESENGTRIEPGAHIPVGSLVRVRLFVYAENGVELPLAVRDPHAAGLEPIDAAQATTPQAALARLLGMSPSDDVADARGAIAMSTMNNLRQVEHDIHASTFYLTRLGSNLAELTYGVRATSTGTFSMPPAELRSETDRSLEARSTAMSITVDP